MVPPGARGRVSADPERDLNQPRRRPGGSRSRQWRPASPAARPSGCGTGRQRVRLRRSRVGCSGAAPTGSTPPLAVAGHGRGRDPHAELAYADGGDHRSRQACDLRRPGRFGAARFQDGSITEFLGGGALPEPTWWSTTSARLCLGRARVRVRARRRAGAGRVPGSAAARGRPPLPAAPTARTPSACGPRPSMRPSWSLRSTEVCRGKLQNTTPAKALASREPPRAICKAQKSLPRWPVDP